MHTDTQTDVFTHIDLIISDRALRSILFENLLKNGFVFGVIWIEEASDSFFGGIPSDNGFKVGRVDPEHE